MHPSQSDNITQKYHKYNKITQQKKFHLLNLIYNDKLPIREAAQVAGINYLTAKTILFFHKNNCKSYRFQLRKQSEGKLIKGETATYSTIKKITDVGEKLIKPKTRIQVICSIGNVLSPPKEEQGNSPITCSHPLQDSQEMLEVDQTSNRHLLIYKSDMIARLFVPQLSSDMTFQIFFTNLQNHVGKWPQINLLKFSWIKNLWKKYIKSSDIQEMALSS